MTSNTAVKKVPSLSIYNINGDTTDLKTVCKGNVTFVDFWFIPCGPCFIEMNMLHKLYSKFKNNQGFRFLTITITDSAFVRPLIENRNTHVNETYDYFKSFANLDTFRLPVYFIQNITAKQLSFKKDKSIYSGHAEPRPKNAKLYPDNIFGFSSYPTIFIFDKNGKTIYSKTGFLKKDENQQLKVIEGIIVKNL